MKMMSLTPVLALALAACGEPDATTVRFEVTVENVSPAWDLSESGVFNTPVGESGPGPLLPGGAYEVGFYAAPGSRLSFATMFVHSNDLFFAPTEPHGLELFDMDGSPRMADITGEVALWDAGTEMNQEPGLGVDQAPRQAGPNTGAADDNTTVRLAQDDFGNLPAVSEVLKVTLTGDADNHFTLRIENVSTETTLSLSDGSSAAVPLAPGVFAVHGADLAPWAAGMGAPVGLEALAEDGDPSALAEDLASRTGLTSPIAPGVWAVGDGAALLFEEGMADRGLGLEGLAEDGDPSGLAAAIEGSGVFNTPVGGSGPAPAFPGESYTFQVEASMGQYLSLATMLVQSNDLFYGADSMDIPLFDEAGEPIEGDITGQLALWDAGTEQNEAPGAGPHQAPRQAGPNMGADEMGVVSQVTMGWPDAGTLLRVTIHPL